MSNTEPQNEDPVEAPAADTVAADAAAFEAEQAKSRDALLRALAEVENTRRRAERQTAEARIYAIDRFANDLLPIADTLGRAIAAVSAQAREIADEPTRNLIEGVELTERALLDAFARHGLKQTGAKGEPFDPNRHQAVAQAPSDQPANTVMEVLQPGYVLGDRTLRAAMVLVSAGPASAAPQGQGGVDIKV